MVEIMFDLACVLLACTVILVISSASHRDNTTLSHRHGCQHAVASAERGTNESHTRIIDSDNDNHELCAADMSIETD